MITTLLFDFINVILLSTPNGYELNQPLIDFVKDHPELKSHVYSSVSPERLTEMRMKLIPPFATVMSSKELGLSKDDPESYHQIAKMLGVPPAEILFIDDKTWNVEAAQRAGCSGTIFTSTDVFLIRAIESLTNERISIITEYDV